VFVGATVGATVGVLVGGTPVGTVTVESLPQPTSDTDANEINKDTNNNAAQIVINHFFI
jgi:Na+/glutamate symporter